MSSWPVRPYGSSKDDRMKALAAATAISKANQALEEIKKFDAMKAADQKQSVRVSISLGSSQSKSSQHNEADQAVGSSLLAGGALSLVATGADKDSNVTVRGSTLTGQDVLLKADNAINLIAARNTSEQHSKDSSSSASVGVGFSLGAENRFGVTVSGSVSKGNSDGIDTSYTTTKVNGGNSVTLQSGGDTALKGAVVTAPKVTADVGGNLKIESLQDTAKFDSKSTSAGGSATFGYGAGGSANFSQSKVNADYAAVGEQAGIRAGDEGFQVSVKGNTDLKGGAITSSQAAIDAGKNSLSTGTLTASDIENRSQYSASAVTVSAGTSGGMAGAYKDSGDERSTTKSTISAGSTTITGGDAASQSTLDKLDRGATNDATAGTLAQGWDGQKLAQQARVNAQIVAEFGAQAAKEVGDYAASKTRPYELAKLEESQLLQSLDKKDISEADRQLLEARLKVVSKTVAAQEATYEDWKEGGNARAALHAVVGGLTGDWLGALGAAASSKAAPDLQKFQDSVKAGLVAAGMDEKGEKDAPSLADGLSKLAAGLLAGAGGAVWGGASSASALNQDFNNRQAHPDQIALVKEEAKKQAGRDGLTEEQWEARLTQQLLLQNDSAYAGGRRGEGNDAVAEKILQEAERQSGLQLDYRGTAEYADHTINTEFLNKTIKSYEMVGVAPSGGLQRRDGTWEATTPGTAPWPTGWKTVTNYPVPGCETPAGKCTYVFFYGSDLAYMQVPKADGTRELYQANEAQQTTMAALGGSQLLRGTGNAPEALWSGLNSTGRELVMVGMDVLTGRAPPTIAQIAFLSVNPEKASGWDPQSDSLQWLFSGKLKEVKPGQAAEAVASIVPVHQLMTFMGNAGAADPNLNQQAGTALGIALAGGIAVKTVDWIPTKLGSAAKVEEAVAEQRHLGKAGEDVASSAGNAIVTQGASGSKPSVMFGNTARADAPLMIPQFNATGTVVRNALEDAEYAQALDVVSFKGGEFVGAPTPKFPGIDGWLDGVPTQLKQTQGPSSVFGIQRNIVGAANDMAKQNYVGYVFVDASGSSVSMQQLLDFTAPGRPISNVLNEGTVNNVYVKLPDGLLNLTKGRLTSSGN